MIRFILFVTLIFFAPSTFSQNNTLFLKQGTRTIYSFWKGKTIAFQTKDMNWQKGEITKLVNDSVYIRPRVVRYFMMGTDTTYLPIEGFSTSDIYAFPKHGVLIDFIDGRFQINRSGGTVNWYWVKSGLVFRISSIVYAGLNITNGLIDHNFSFSDSKTTLAICAAVWGFGFMLHKIYKPVLPVGRKYHIEVLKL